MNRPPSDATQLLLTPDLRVGITGHRSLAPVLRDRYAVLLDTWFSKLRPAQVVSGMALGIDIMAADIALERGIALHAVVPGTWQPNRWRSADQDHYAEVLARAAKVTIVDSSPLPPDPGPARAKVISTLMRRNASIIGACDLLVACWDGRSGGGTTQALRKACDMNRPVLRLYPGSAARLALGSVQIQRLLNEDVEIGPIKTGLPTGLVPV